MRGFSRKSETLVMLPAAGLFTVLGLMTLSVFNTSAFPIDDAFISFRYGRNLIDGFGLVFNPGERVEAYSNFLWLLLVSGLHYLSGVSQIVAARVLGLASLTGLCLLLFLQLRRATQSLFLPFAITLVFTLLTETIFHALSGMETMLSALLVLAVGTILESNIEPHKKAWFAGLCLGAFSLNRPDGLLVSACILAGTAIAWLLKEKGRLHAAWLLLSYACILVPFLAWRLLYYGSLLPNSVVAKGGSLHPSVLEAGVNYVAPFIIWHAPILLLAVFALFSGERVRSIQFRIPVSVAFGVTALLGGVGDGYAYSRYLYPLLACLVVWSVEGGLSFSRWVRRNRSRAMAGLGFLVLLVLCSVQLFLFIQQYRQAGLIANRIDPLSRPAAFFRDTPASANPDRLRAEGLGHHQAGAWLRENASPRDLLATYEIGIVPYLSRLPVVDLYGLADRHIARTPGRPGQRTDWPYVWNRNPAYIMLRLPSDCLCSTSQIFFDRRLKNEYDLVEIFPYWTTDILLFKRRQEPTERILQDLTSISERRTHGPIGLLERVQLVRPEERKRLLTEIRDRKTPDAMRKWIGTWKSAFILAASKPLERGAVNFELRVPYQASLAFAIGAIADQDSLSNGSPRKARLRILVQDNQKTRILFESDVNPNATPGWEDLRVSLEPFAGQQIGLSFEIESQGLPRVGVAEPRILTAGGGAMVQNDMDDMDDMDEVDRP